MPDKARHTPPHRVTVEGMFGAALDTVRQNILDDRPSSIVAAYSFAGEFRFACAFDDLQTPNDVLAAWENLEASGADMWFSILYAPFKFDVGNVVSLRHLLSCAILVGYVDRAEQGTEHGMMGLIRDHRFIPLDMALNQITEGNPQFTFNYNELPL